MSNARKLIETFGRSTGLFIPVIHHAGKAATVESIRIAQDAGADGVCLIDQGIPWSDLIQSLPYLRRAFPNMPIGLNLLAAPPCIGAPGQRRAVGHADFHWTDHRDSFADPLEEPWLGGVAFKTEGPVHPDAYPGHISTALSEGATVCVTSGPGTGLAAPLEKVRALRALLDVGAARTGVEPFLGLASGVTVENVEQYLGSVDLFLVASGIERVFGRLDPELTDALAEKIHFGGAPE